MVEQRIQIWSMGPADEDFLQTAESRAAAEVNHGSLFMPGTSAAPTASVSRPVIPIEPPKPKKESILPPPSDWFPATCGRCGKDTTVPFKPDGSRRIFCKDCYKHRHDDEIPGITDTASVSVPSVLPVVAAQEGEESPAKKKRRRRKKKSGSSSGFAYDTPDTTPSNSGSAS
jgi:CxxC-x17-CxxC domain-containing protein